MSEIEIPLRGMPKARPVVTRNGTYMPKEYSDWKEQIGWALREQGVTPEGYEMNMELEVRFSAKSITLQLYPTDEVRPKGIRADLDNLVGGIMDALQDYGLIKDDRQIIKVEASLE